MHLKPLSLVIILYSLATWKGLLVGAEATFPLQIAVSDVHDKPLPCRIHLFDQQGHPQKVAGQPFWHDHFVFSGRVAASLAPGKYEYAIERGPEFQRKTGQLDIEARENRALNVTLERIADLRAAGWYSADLHVHRPLEEIEQLMSAEDLDFSPVITWWNNRNLWKNKVIPRQLVRQFDGFRIYNVMAGEDEREGGALLYVGLNAPLRIQTGDREFPSPLQFAAEARKQNRIVWIDIEKPFWWDVPVWLASGQMNSIGIANNHMCRGQMFPSEAWGKSRDVNRLSGPRGNGFWSQEIYYHMLNSGLHLPPSAGSASGVLPNPLGYNRVYVHLDEPFTCDAWFHGLSRGRSFVTNGPLLLVTADEHDPGKTFKLRSGEKRTLRINIQLTSQDPVSQIEIVKNGRVSHSVKCSDELTQRHVVEFSVDEPGWFLVRTIANIEKTFRFASTAPWFVEVGNLEHRISRRSVQFFVDWAGERFEQVRSNIKDEIQRDEVLVWHKKARAFWSERLKYANAD
jgi:hypothetical protein